MRILGAVLVLLGAWMFLAVPMALVMGRFLRASDVQRARQEPVSGAPRRSAA